MMVDRINDILWQAQQGSVAAIIQVLNQKLADSGVRTRAMFADGVLQLLCEAHTVDKLEKSTLVNQIRQIIESIAPRNIYRININSRIVREQQLLWLEEINRNPENQLLWSEEITLEKPSAFKQFVKDLQEKKAEPTKISLPSTQSSHSIVIARKNKPKTSALGWLFLGASICMFFVMLSGALYILFNGGIKASNQADNSKSILSVAKSLETQNNNNTNLEQTSTARKDTPETEDFFLEAVRIANVAAATGKEAKTATQWLQLAANWQRASDLMAKVAPNHSRYKEAQIRTKLYRQYSEAAQKEAEKKNE